MAINLTNSNIKGKCDLKCDYNFKYSNSNSIATNMGTSIQISYEDTGIPPATYNNIKYIVSMIQITYPSSILYNNSPALGSLLIEHTSIKDKGIFQVIIPLISGSSTSTASFLISQVIQSVATNAPNTKENVNLSIQDFTLQSIIPNAPFFTTNTSNGTPLIMFDLKNAISISDTDYQSLSNIITASSTNQSSSSSNNIFYNPKGPTSGGGSSSGNDNIYIDCQPVNVSEETIQMSTENKLSMDYQLKSEYNARDTLLKIFYKLRLSQQLSSHLMVILALPYPPFNRLIMKFCKVEN
jgi:hypothetical protein